MVEQKNSLGRAWAELEALQAEMLEQKAEIQILKTEVNNLKRNVESEKQKRLHLDFYSRRENLILIGVKENCFLLVGWSGAGCCGILMCIIDSGH